jgi:mono/diheme cytochrome c family protein
MGSIRQPPLVRAGLIVLLLVGLAAAGSGRAWASFPAHSAEEGEAIFQQKCAGCHSIGGGRLVGPDLKGVTGQRDRTWLEGFIGAPDKLIASGDPIAAQLLQEYSVPMPNLGLSPDEVSAVLEYLDAQGGAAGAEPTPAPIVNLPAGDAGRGEALFLGTVDLSEDGPPCMGCHSIDSAGALGGGVLGPSLAGVAARYGDAGLAAALANIPWPTMQPVYTAHPLAPQEQADLRAYLLAVSGQPQANTEVAFLVLSLAGFFAAMIAIGIVWRHRLRSVRRPLVEGQQSGH